MVFSQFLTSFRTTVLLSCISKCLFSLTVSSPGDTRVSRQETVIAAFQCILAFVLASISSHPRSGGLVRTFLSLCACWRDGHWLMPEGMEEAWGLWSHCALPLHLWFRVCVPDTGLLSTFKSLSGNQVDPQQTHAIHLLTRGSPVFLSTRGVVCTFLITACLGWRKASGYFCFFS